jgi:hypothetical protein
VSPQDGNNEPATAVVPFEPRRRSATATLRAIYACLLAAASAQLSGEELRVYCALLLFVDENSECFPSQSTLSELTGLDRRSVRRALAGLQKDALLRRSPRWREDGARLSDLYDIGRRDAPAPGATPWREDAPAPGATPWREDAPRKGETQNKTNQYLNLEGARGSDADGRSAPLLHSSTQRAAARQPQLQPSVLDQHAYQTEVKARRRRGFLDRLNGWISRRLRGIERDKAWQAVGEASLAGSRAATPKATTRLLDELEKRRREESAK